MTTNNIREQLEKLKSLLRLYGSLSKGAGAENNPDIETIGLKMKVAKEEMLKCTYKVGHFLKELEERV